MRSSFIIELRLFSTLVCILLAVGCQSARIIDIRQPIQGELNKQFILEPKVSNLLPRNSALVFFLTSSEGWAECLEDKLCHTVDAGKTWNIISDKLLNFNFIFLDSSTGYAFGHERKDMGRLFRTDDGGRSWRLVKEVGSSIEALSITREGKAYLSTWDSGLFRNQSQENWEEVVLEREKLSDSEIQSELETGLKFVVITDSDNLIGYGSGVWLLSTDRDKWINQVPIQESGVLSSSSCYQKNCWIVGFSKYIFRTDGATRVDKYQLPTVGYDGDMESLSYSTVSFISPSMGWVVRNDRAIFQTSDGGKNWRFKSKPLRQFREIKFVSSTEGWSVSDTGDLSHTQDAGVTWSPALVQQ